MQTQNAMLFIQSQLTWQKNKSLVSVTTGKDIEVEDLVAEVHVRNAGFWRRRHRAIEEELDHLGGQSHTVYVDFLDLGLAKLHIYSYLHRTLRRLLK